MKLFDIEIDATKNLLLKDGTANYYGKLLKWNEANLYLDLLLNNIAWQNDKAIIYGKKIVTKRKVAWYGNKPFEYTYSNTKKLALPWTKELLELKMKVEQKTGEASAKWYTTLFDWRNTQGGDELAVLESENNEILICLHKWGEHEHPTITNPGNMHGNGLILYFGTEKMNQIRQNVEKMVTLWKKMLAKIQTPRNWNFHCETQTAII